MKYALFFLVCLTLPQVTEATTFTSIADGDWTNPAVWTTDDSSGGIPNVTNSAPWPGDNVVINHQITFTGDLATAKRASITVNNGGKFIVTGDLSIANSNASSFTIMDGGILEVGDDLNIPTCCNNISLGGTVNATNLSFTGSVQVLITGNLNLSGNLTTSGGSSILFNGATANVAGSTSVNNGVKFYVDGGAYLDFGDLSLTGNGDIIGQGSAGILAFNTLSLANSSTQINCVGGACSYSGAGGSPSPPNPLNLFTGLLPVELLYYRAAVDENDLVILEWATASESSNDYFLIEHSSDGRNFEAIGQLDGVGDSQELTYYQYKHVQTLAETHYYRLWQYDFDGSSEQLGVVRVQIAGTNPYLGPNPISAGATLVFDATFDLSNTQIVLFDLAGRSWAIASRGAALAGFP